MKRKKTVDINTLVDLVVNTARADTTSPDPKNPRVGWQTDQLLIGHVDKLMTYQRNDPAAYAEIGRRVSVQVGDLPEMEALAHIAVIRGERLGPVSAKRKSRVLAMITDLGPKINLLPPGSRKERCRSLFAYNQGVFYDAYEMFGQAAELQRQSAEIAQANGDKPGEAIGYFLQAVYQLKDALCQPSTDEAKAVFSIMEERYAKLVEAVQGTPLEISWGQGNAPCHLFQACYVWLGEDHPDLGKWLASVVSAAGSLKGVWKEIAEHYSVIDSLRRRDGWYKQAKTELEKVAAESGDATRKAEVLLVLARQAIKDGNARLARELVKKMPKKGASHLLAVGQRLVEPAKP